MDLSADPLSISNEECLARESVGVLSRVQASLASLWEKPTSDAVVCTIALVAALDTKRELIDLKLPKLMAQRVCASIAKLNPDAPETIILLLSASKRKSTVAHGLCSNRLIAQKVDAVAGALQLTLKEQLPAQIWTNHASKLVCVMAFHGTESPLATLAAIFGVLNKSDVRRCEDLHDATCAAPLDTYAMCLVVECVVGLLVL